MSDIRCSMYNGGVSVKIHTFRISDLHIKREGEYVSGLTLQPSVLRKGKLG
jgi:hypothetical protein